MFVVYVGSILTTILCIQALVGQGEAPPGFILAVTLWLWFTVLFANFAEAIAEGRSKAQAATPARRAARGRRRRSSHEPQPRRDSGQACRGRRCASGDVVLVEAGDFIPADGEVIEGVASVDESAITGESAPVIRESGGDFQLVTGGTRVLSDWLVVRVTVEPGRDLPRPHDRDGRGRAAARRRRTRSRSTILLVGADARLPARDRHAAAVLDLQRRRGRRPASR